MFLAQNVDETGVSADYWNEWGIMAIDLQDGSYEKVIQELRQYRVKGYCERFGVLLNEVLTPKNEQNIRRLEELSQQANALADRYSEDPEGVILQLKQMVNEVKRLIYGSTSPEPYFPEVS